MIPDVYSSKNESYKISVYQLFVLSLSSFPSPFSIHQTRYLTMTIVHIGTEYICQVIEYIYSSSSSTYLGWGSNMCTIIYVLLRPLYVPTGSCPSLMAYWTSGQSLPPPHHITSSSPPLPPNPPVIT